MNGDNTLMFGMCCCFGVQPRRGEQELLLKNTETLKRASASLYRAQQVSAQTGTHTHTHKHAYSLRSYGVSVRYYESVFFLATDEIADNVVVELDDQRASLLRTRNRVCSSLTHTHVQLTSCVKAQPS